MSACNPELVSAYLDGELDEVILEKVTDHLLKCDNCQKLMSVFATVKDSVSEHFAIHNGEEFTSSIMATIHEEPLHRETPAKSFSLADFLENHWIRYVGVPVAVAGAALLIWNQQAGDDAHKAMLAEKQRLEQHAAQPASNPQAVKVNASLSRSAPSATATRANAR